MRQLLTRVDDDLHRRLKARAKTEGRSMNAVVTAILEDALPPTTERERYREKLRAEGRLYEPLDRKSTRLNSSHIQKSRMPSSA